MVIAASAFGPRIPKHDIKFDKLNERVIGYFALAIPAEGCHSSICGQGNVQSKFVVSSMLIKDTDLAERTLFR